MPSLVAVTSLPDAARFLFSAALLLFCSMALARRLGATWGDRFWIAIAAAVMQVATIAIVLSPMHALTPLGFLLAQCLTAVVIGWTCRGVGHDEKLTLGAGLKPITATPSRRLLLLLIGVFLLLGLWLTIVLPISSFDDRMYRASRAAYWLQHRGVWPWSTHNIRQVAFPFGSELLFFWPLLFTRWEPAGRLAFFGGVPLGAAGLYALIRQLRATRMAALAGVLVLLATPAITHIQEGLFPPVWMTLFALGAAYFALRAASDPSRATRHLAWMGCFVALAVNVKQTALALAPAALLVPWVATTASRWRGTISVIGGAAAGVLLSGLALTFTANLLRDGHPLGPPELSATHTSDLSARQLRTHAARFVAGLIDPPVVPTEATRRALTDAGNALLRLCRADAPLPGEGPPAPWPGLYGFGVGRYASRYSLAGILWLPALAIAAAVVVFVARGATRRRLATLLMLLLPMLLGTVLIIRWMGGMDRFWVAAYALSLPILVLLLQHAARRWRWTRSVIVAAMALSVLPVLWDRARTVDEWRRTPPPEMLLNEPFHSSLREIPSGSTILLVAQHDTRDYGLFLPRRGFVNRVVSWGDGPFDAARLQRLLDGHGVTHVLLEREMIAPIVGGTPIDMRPMVRWLTQHPALRELPAVTPGMRLFGRAESVTTRP